MKNEYISVSEFARRAGVSKQAIYKRLSTDLSTYIKMIDGRKMLKSSALEHFKSRQEDNQTANQVETINLLKKTIDMLEKELAAKDRQIEALQQMVDQEQKLHAVTSQRLLAANSDPEEQAKRHWWQRWQS